MYYVSLTKKLLKKLHFIAGIKIKWIYLEACAMKCGMPHIFILSYFGDHLAFVVVTLINAFAILVRKMFSLSPITSTFAPNIQIHHNNNWSQLKIFWKGRYTLCCWTVAVSKNVLPGTEVSHTTIVRLAEADAFLSYCKVWRTAVFCNYFASRSEAGTLVLQWALGHYLLCDLANPHNQPFYPTATVGLAQGFYFMFRIRELTRVPVLRLIQQGTVLSKPHQFINKEIQGGQQQVSEQRSSFSLRFWLTNRAKLEFHPTKLNQLTQIYEQEQSRSQEFLWKGPFRDTGGL